MYPAGPLLVPHEIFGGVHGRRLPFTTSNGVISALASLGSQTPSSGGSVSTIDTKNRTGTAIKITMNIFFVALVGSCLALPEYLLCCAFLTHYGYQYRSGFPGPYPGFY
ncbi:hypothetical protein Patl1_33941 [Pistacia atlantica]|uniref:Uncharacterized protein n=1 Tax=Pistacia atlantica TaxID=434234 RepID=A0ACC0ZT51_9ROSI|nr:hypothetical protein Patl1_33941 [Pistacia atlantica]